MALAAPANLKINPVLPNPEDQLDENGNPILQDEAAAVIPQTGVVDYNGETPELSDEEQALQTQANPQQQLLDLYSKLSEGSKKAIEEQKKGLGENETRFNKLEGMEQPVNLRSALNVADWLTGGNAAQGYKQPISPEEKQKELITLQAALQTQRGGVTDKELQLLKDQIMGITTKNKEQERMDRAEYQAGNRWLNTVQSKLASNPMLAQQLGSYNTLDNALTNLATGKQISPTQVEEFQSRIIQALGQQGGKSGVEERAEQRFHALDLNRAKLEQLLYSKPVDISEDKELLGHLQDMARQEQLNLRGQYHRRLEALGAGGEYRFFDKFPKLKQDWQATLDSYSGQFASPLVPDITTLNPKVERKPIGGKLKPFAPTPGVKKPMSFEEWKAAGSPKAGE